MNYAWRLFFTAIATVCTTETVYYLSRFKYGQNSVFSQPFDLVNFTVKMVWWFGCWFFFLWIFSKFSVNHLKQQPGKDSTKL